MSTQHWKPGDLQGEGKGKLSIDLEGIPPPVVLLIIPFAANKRARPIVQCSDELCVIHMTSKLQLLHFPIFCSSIATNHNGGGYFEDRQGRLWGKYDSHSNLEEMQLGVTFPSTLKVKKCGPGPEDQNRVIVESDYGKWILLSDSVADKLEEVYRTLCKFA